MAEQIRTGSAACTAVGSMPVVADAKHLTCRTPGVSSPVPIVRAEELALVRAQIQLGLGNFANAIALINQVHVQAGGFGGPLAITPDLHRRARQPAQGTANLDGVRSQRRPHDRPPNVRPRGVADTTWQAKSGPDGRSTPPSSQRLPHHDCVAAAVELSRAEAPGRRHVRESPSELATPGTKTARRWRALIAPATASVVCPYREPQLWSTMALTATMFAFDVSSRMSTGGCTRRSRFAPHGIRRRQRSISWCEYWHTVWSMRRGSRSRAALPSPTSRRWRFGT